MVLIKTGILTSPNVLYTKSRVISSCFAKRCFPKYGFFSLKMSALAKKKLTQLVYKFHPTKEWLNKVTLSSFKSKTFSNSCLRD